PRVHSRSSGEPCAAACASRVRLDVHDYQGKPLHLRDERDGAPAARQAREPHQLPVFGMTAGRLLCRDTPYRLDRLERLEQLRQVHAEPVALRVPAGGLDDLARAQPEPQAARNRQRLEAALQAHRVVVGRDEGVERLLLLGYCAARFDVGSKDFHATREVFLALGGEPLLGQPALELLRAAELAQDQVQLAHHQLEQLDLPVEQLEDVRLDGPCGGEVHDVDLARLPDAVQPSDALLHHHRVPGEVVVHEHVAELQVTSFAAGAGGDEDARLVLVEGADALVPLGGRVSTPIHDGLAAELLDALFNQLNRRAVIAEDHGAVRRFAQQLG